MRLAPSLFRIAVTVAGFAILIPAIVRDGALAKTAAPAVNPTPALVRTAAAAPPPAFRKCSGCHATIANRASPGGPNLFGIGGRVSGTLPRATYSAAMKKAAIRWDARSLDAFIADPRGKVPGNIMFTAPEKDAAARKQIVTYLLSLK